MNDFSVFQRAFQPHSRGNFVSRAEELSPQGLDGDVGRNEGEGGRLWRGEKNFWSLLFHRVLIRNARNERSLGFNQSRQINLSIFYKKLGFCFASQQEHPMMVELYVFYFLQLRYLIVKSVSQLHLKLPPPGFRGQFCLIGCE